MSGVSENKIVLQKVPMLNLSKLQSSESTKVLKTGESKKAQSYKRDAATLLVNRLTKKFREFFIEIKDFAAF